MKKFLVIALVGLLAGSANAMVLGLHGGSAEGPLHGYGDPLILNVSETANIYMVAGVAAYNYYSSPIFDPAISGADVFMDTIQTDPPGDIFAEDVEVIGVTQSFDPEWVWTDYRLWPGGLAPFEFGDLDPGDPGAVDFETYAVLGQIAEPYLPAPAEMPAEPMTWTLNNYVLDVITIHCTSPSVDELYFESPDTVQPGPDARVPWLYYNGTTFYYTPQGGIRPDEVTPGGAALNGTIIFENGYVDRTDDVILKWYETEPFVIVQLIPEPTSLALLRRKR